MKHTNTNKELTPEEAKEFWNSLAQPCSHYARRSAYADRFLKVSGIRPGETVLDMGCGSGTLCLPLADDGHKVFCVDFSDKMLQSVQDVIDEEGLTLLTLCRASWQDDWDEKGIPVCDLAFASRSLLGIDPKEIFPKLSSRARRRVCVSLAVDPRLFDDEHSPYHFEEEDKGVYLRECVNAVFDLGFYPEVSYLEPPAVDSKTWAFLCWDIF